MEDKRAITLFQLASKRAATIPAATPIRTLQHQARRLLNLPDEEIRFSEADLITVVSTMYPMVWCLRKILSYSQIKILLDKMEEGEKNADGNNQVNRLSENNEKPN